MNKQEKKQALKLSALFKELAKKGTWFEYRDREDGWRREVVRTPNMQTNLSLWRVVEPKKIIDLSIMIGSDIDMEFTDCNGNWEIGILDEIISGYNFPYVKLNCEAFKKCRVGQNRIQWYKGFPLPDGLLVTLYYNDIPPETYKSQDIVWNNLHCDNCFEIIDTLPEYKYGWEEE